MTVDQVTERILQWIAGIARDLRCAQADAGAAPPADLVLSLVSVRPSAAPTSPAGHLELQLEYTCTARDGTDPKVQQALGEIAFAGLESGEYNVAGLTAGQLGLAVSTTLSRPRGIVRGPRVRTGMWPMLRPISHLSGVLLREGGAPVAGAAVRFEGTANPRESTTDVDGRFRLVLPERAASLPALVVTVGSVRQIATAGRRGPETTFVLTLED